MPLELGGVVTPELIVYGTENLRVVDSSIMPMLPAAHLQAVVYGVAEKVSQSKESWALHPIESANKSQAADIIKAAQGLDASTSLPATQSSFSEFPSSFSTLSIASSMSSSATTLVSEVTASSSTSSPPVVVVVATMTTLTTVVRTQTVYT